MCCPLDTALGLRSVGTDNVDVQFVERSAELRQTCRPILLGAMRRAEDAVLVAVEGERLAPFLQIRLRGDQVIERILRPGEAKMQQLAGRIVDEDEQDTFGTAVLEPPVMRAIDLNQFTEAVGPATRLRRSCSPACVTVSRRSRMFWKASSRCNSFCDMVIKQDMTTPTAHGPD